MDTGDIDDESSSEDKTEIIMILKAELG